MCVHITVHNCHTQYSTEQLCQSSFLSSKQSSLVGRCLLLERGAINQSINQSKGRNAIQQSFHTDAHYEYEHKKCIFYITVRHNLISS